jgi:hypothetical protein
MESLDIESLDMGHLRRWHLRWRHSRAIAAPQRSSAAAHLILINRAGGESFRSATRKRAGPPDETAPALNRS